MNVGIQVHTECLVSVSQQRSKIDFWKMTSDCIHDFHLIGFRMLVQIIRYAPMVAPWGNQAVVSWEKVDIDS